MSLDDYRKKRNFKSTPEPEPGSSAQRGSEAPLRFVVHMHQAGRLHFDLRLEFGGSYKSWAVPKGPSLNPLDQRLAIHVEDHPIEYGEFEGVIPKGNYGAGTVMIWDYGTLVERSSQGRLDSEAALAKGLEDGHITVVLEGQKLNGEFALVRLKGSERTRNEDGRSWLFLKKRDTHAVFRPMGDDFLQSLSARTGRTMAEITAEAPAKAEVWVPKRATPTPAAAPAKQKPVKPPELPPPSRAEGKQEPAAPEKFPRALKPMLAVAAKEPFEAQEGWIFETFGSGTRVLVELQKGGPPKIRSKQQLSLNAKFKELLEPLSRVPHTALVDGEVLVGPPITLRALDLLHCDGKNLRPLPLLERKRILAGVLEGHAGVEAIPHVEKLSELEEYPYLARAGQSAYAPGTSRNWLSLPHEAVERGPKFTHLSKLFWPAGGGEPAFTKGDLIDYYRKMASVIVPHLRGRPESLHRQPDGILGESFFQKNTIGYLPKFAHIERRFSESSGRSIDYLVCDNEATLLYMINLGCIELNPWLSRVGSLTEPDFSVIDLDPDDANTFDQVIEVALGVREVLVARGLEGYCKTSGATGLHICVPMSRGGTYDQSRQLAIDVCAEVMKRFPALTSMERSPGKRRGRIYLDAYQNSEGQTLAAAYCVRPRARPTVSTPLEWGELVPGLDPASFTVQNVPTRVAQKGDLWAPLLKSLT